MQEYYEGSKRSEDLLLLARRTLERLRKVGYCHTFWMDDSFFMCTKT